MGHRHSTFNKANFKRGIRGYRKMFASLQLEEKELKKLWLEFGKIDRDGGGTVSGRWMLRTLAAGWHFLNVKLLISYSSVFALRCHFLPSTLWGGG